MCLTSIVLYQFEAEPVASSSTLCDSELYKQHAEPGIESSWTLTCMSANAVIIIIIVICTGGSPLLSLF